MKKLSSVIERKCSSDVWLNKNLLQSDIGYKNYLWCYFIHQPIRKDPTVLLSCRASLFTLNYLVRAVDSTLLREDQSKWDVLVEKVHKQTFIRPAMQKCRGRIAGLALLVVNLGYESSKNPFNI